jgi:hypothetical protein
MAFITAGTPVVHSSFTSRNPATVSRLGLCGARRRAAPPVVSMALGRAFEGA